MPLSSMGIRNDVTGKLWDGGSRYKFELVMSEMSKSHSNGPKWLDA